MDFVKCLAYKTPMTHRFLTHFGTIFLIHAGLIFGGLTIIENEVVSQKIGQHILNLKVASEVLLASPRQRVVARPKTIPSSTAVPTIQETAPAQDAKPGLIPDVGANSLSGTAMADLKSIYKAELRARIDQNKFYPPAARRLNQTGTVVVAFTLQNDGTIINVRIDHTSGNNRLDSAGLEAVKKVGKFKAIPTEFGSASMDMSVPIKFQTI